MFKLLEKEFDRQIIKFIKKAYKKNSNKKLYKDFIMDEVIKYGWHGFIPATYSHIKDWREYYYKNLRGINDLKESLYKNLDPVSVKQAELIFNRNINFLPIENTQSFLMMNLYKLFTEEELIEQNRLKQVSTDYKLANGEKVDAYIDVYEHGFAFIKDFAKNYVIDKDFIDGGAYIGDSALVLNKFKPRKIYTFEPEIENFKLLQETIALNELQNNIIPIKKGLSNKNQILSFEGDNVCGKISEISRSEQISHIEVTYIDEFVQKNDLHPALIKLDIEGAEYDAIIGAQETIKKLKPILLISIYHTAKDFFEIKPLIESMGEYKFLIRATRPDMLNTEFILIGYPAELKND